MPRGILKSPADFVSDARKTHGNLYLYDTIKYVNDRTPIKIECKIHGIFTQRPSDHLQGKGCVRCAHRSSSDIFKLKATQRHSSRYDYSKVVYTTSKTKIEIICREHGSFSQTPNQHLSGQGCPTCGRDGWCLFDIKNNPSLSVSPAILYLIRMTTDKESFLKIGKTRRTVNRRYSGKIWNHVSINVVCQVQSSYSKISLAEVAILKQWHEFAVRPTNIPYGYTECFSLEAESSIVEYMRTLHE
jgi:hypothetical protein